MLPRNLRYRQEEGKHSLLFHLELKTLYICHDVLERTCRKHAWALYTHYEPMDGIGVPESKSGEVEDSNF
jgi:hypothetical protein